MTALEAIAWTVAAAGMLSGGLALLVTRRAVPCGALLMLTGVGFAGALTLPERADDPASWALLIAGLVVAPLALCCYPAPGRGVVERTVMVLLPATGTVGVLLGGPGTESAALVCAVVLIGLLWWRIERSVPRAGSADPEGRERLLLIWLGLVFGTVTLVSLLAAFAADGRGAGIVSGLAVATVGPALAVGMLRRGVVDVRALVVPVVVTTVAGIAYVATLVLLLRTFETLGGQLPSGAVALLAFVVALLLPPLRTVLRGVIDDLLFGGRPGALAAAGLAAREIGDDLTAAVARVRDALVLPYLAVVADGVVVAEDGDPLAQTCGWPLPTSNGPAAVRVAELRVGLRLGDLRLGRDDQDVLAVVAPLLAQTLRAAELTRQLREARERAVAAIADERRRLRRDLHDGLGPRLSGLAYTAAAAGNLLASDPVETARLLAAIRSDAAAAVAAVRGVVEGLRPPALDEVGLVAALEQRAQLVRRRDGIPLRVTFDVDELPKLAAAVEVSAYWIVSEALANVAAHSTGAAVQVRMRLDRGALLSILVTDDGGPGAPWSIGVGTSSMTERAQEVGGQLTAGPTASGGRVLARLPLA